MSPSGGSLIGRLSCRGISLLETVIAIFILLTAFTFVAALYASSLSHLREAESKEEANRLLLNTMDDLRVWARDPANYASAVWAPYLSVTDSGFPDFEVRVQTSPVRIAASCDAFEASKPVSERVTLNDSAKRVTAEVRHKGRVLTQLTTILPEPERTIRVADPIVVQPISGLSIPLAREEEAVFQATLIDSAGDAVNDVSFSWAVVPSTGNASIFEVNPARDQGTLKNTNHYYAGPVYYTGGKCRVEATATYQGIQYTGLSDEIELAP
jgi:Tfp pilus assembly protein PilV